RATARRMAHCGLRHANRAARNPRNDVGAPPVLRPGAATLRDPLLSSSSALQKILTAFDFALRLAFFAAAPFVVAFAAALFPITGALVQVALALAIFFVADRARRLA